MRALLVVLLLGCGGGRAVEGADCSAWLRACGAPNCGAEACAESKRLVCTQNGGFVTWSDGGSIALQAMVWTAVETCPNGCSEPTDPPNAMGVVPLCRP